MLLVFPVLCSHLEFLGGGGMLLLSPERQGRVAIFCFL